VGWEGSAAPARRQHPHLDRLDSQAGLEWPAGSVAFAGKKKSRPALLLVVHSRRAHDRHSGTRTRTKAGVAAPCCPALGSRVRNGGSVTARKRVLRPAANRTAGRSDC
jgi:hypothetical protein